MKSVTFVRKRTVAKYGMGCVAPDVLREGWLLRAAERKCPPNTVPRVREVEWVTFDEAAASKPLREACIDAGVRLGDVPVFCVGAAEHGRPVSLDQIALCDPVSQHLRAAVGLEPAAAAPDKDCCCTACKHKLTDVVVEPVGAAPHFTEPGDCLVATCKNDALELTLVVPKNPFVCGAMIKMDRIQGVTARRAVRATPEAAPETAKQVFAALGRLHAGGIAHNDCKLDNFIVGEAGAVCIDLEMATAADAPAFNLAGVVADAAGLQLEWSPECQKADVTQACMAFGVLCGSHAPAICATIARLAEPYTIGESKVYFRRGPKTAFIDAAVAVAAV